MLKKKKKKKIGMPSTTVSVAGGVWFSQRVVFTGETTGVMTNISHLFPVLTVC